MLLKNHSLFAFVVTVAIRINAGALHPERGKDWVPMYNWISLSVKGNKLYVWVFLYFTKNIIQIIWIFAVNFIQFSLHNPLRKAMINDLRNCAANHLKNIKGILVCGDLAYSGKNEEFQIAATQQTIGKFIIIFYWCI